jgi:NitT/TauT family transport system permease protein
MPAVASLRYLLPVLVGLATLGGWEALVRVNEIPPYILPGPVLIAQTLVADWGTLWPSLMVTLEITALALVVATLGGVGNCAADPDLCR